MSRSGIQRTRMSGVHNPRRGPPIPYRRELGAREARWAPHNSLNQPAAPGPDGGIQDANGNFGTPMMEIVTVRS